MPRYIDYGSAFAIVNPDGSTTDGDIQYHWDGSKFVLIRHQWITNVADTDFRIQQIARNGNEGNIASYVDASGHHSLLPVQIAWLRIAIERGHISLERAQSVFGEFRALGAKVWAFAPDLPEQVSESQELTFFGDFPGPDIDAVDVLTKPNSYVNSTVTDRAFSAWRAPVGIPLEQAIGQAWLNHAVPQVAGAAQALLDESTGIERGESRVAFGLANSGHQDWIQKLYLAFFLRPADPGGFNYYAQKLDAGGSDISAVATGFGNSPEYLQTYAGMNTAQRIDAIYQNLFARRAEPDGLKYWGDRLDSGTFNISNIAFSILVGAQNADAATINNRINLSKQFTAALDTQRELEAYTGLEAASEAREFLGIVTSNPSSIADAEEKMNQTIKFLGVSGEVSRATSGDSISLQNLPSANIIIYSAADRGRSDVVTGFGSHDRLELSALRLPNNLHTRALAPPDLSDSSTLFGKHSVIIAHDAGNSYVYVDANGDGAFSASQDIKIQIMGAEILAGAVTI